MHIFMLAQLYLITNCVTVRQLISQYVSMYLLFQAARPI